MLRRRIVPIMLLLVFMLVLVAPLVAMAQDTSGGDSFVTNTPAVTVQATVNGNPVEATLVTPTIPNDEPTSIGWLTQITPWLIVMGIVALIVLGVLGRTFIVQLGASAPVAFYQMIKAASEAGLAQLGELTISTENTVDDAGYAELRKQFDSLVKEIEEMRKAHAALAERFLPPTNAVG